MRLATIIAIVFAMLVFWGVFAAVIPMLLQDMEYKISKKVKRVCKVLSFLPVLNIIFFVIIFIIVIISLIHSVWEDFEEGDKK